MYDGKYNVVCPTCRKLLLKCDVADVEIKCSKCRSVWSIYLIDKELMICEV